MQFCGENTYINVVWHCFHVKTFKRRLDAYRPSVCTCGQMRETNLLLLCSKVYFKKLLQCKCLHEE